MNTIGIALVWCIVQVTLVGLLAGGLYLLVRPVRRAAAAPVVLAGLTMVAALSLFALSPWPRWTLSDSAGSPAEDRGVTTTWQAQTADIDNSHRSGDERPELAVRPSLPTILWQTFVDALSASPAPTTGWRWPAMVAVALLATAACGLGWLLLGVAAVRRQRRRSRPVRDPAILELIDVLRAELGCVRPVELRQSDDLVTAATIGWRRPVVLLSSDWPTWTSPQLRAVLAHEIAHARSHDFLALVLGQLGVMLHFYHPLVHWLMSRLRLEQELAADAAAASISGGQRQYLMTIAELALRQQGRPLSWPARTFLPTQSTFLRRIAMLRDSKLRFERLSPVVRFAVIGLVLLCGLLVAGLRGPESPPLVLAAEPEKSGDEKPEATTASNSAPKSENILANSSAEKGEDYADAWMQGRSIEGVKYVWDKSTACEGKASLCIKKSVNNYFPIAAWSQTVARTGDLPCLKVSAQVKTKKIYKAILDVTFLNESDQGISHKWAAYIGAENAGDAPANHDWKKYSGTVQIPEGTAKLCISLQDYGPGTV
jgi:beta-lactamase regulating signal transducer with metallopeptidase domain